MFERDGEGGMLADVVVCVYRTLVYLEGEASMRKFERDGRVESALSIVQRERSPFLALPSRSLANEQKCRTD